MWRRTLAARSASRIQSLPLSSSRWERVYRVSSRSEPELSLSFEQFVFFFILDTFASKVAAIQDKYADASVGNVTGSNAVNVFLGIGVAWTIAAVYHAWHGRSFDVDPGT